jgi:beta-lactamase class C
MRSVYFIAAAVAVAICMAFAYSLTKNKSQAKAKPLAVVSPSKSAVFINRETNPHFLSALDEYEKFITEAIQQKQAPGAAVVVVKDSSIIYLKGFGVKESGKPDLIDANSVFRLGSVSKCFASVLTGILVNDHTLSWDDHVSQYLPSFRLKSEESTRQLTLRHVLSHTIGLPHHAFTNMIEEHVPFDTLVNHLKDVELTGKPGEIYSYQNVGFSLIGKVIESTTHQKFEKILHDKLFAPLHMQNASASYQEITSNPDVAKPHRFVNNAWKAIPISNEYYDVCPAGGVNASIADVGLFLKALLGNVETVLPKERLDEIFQPYVRATSKNHSFGLWQRPKASYYAMGWRVITFKNDTLEYHGGYVNGYRSEIAIDRKRRIAICMLVNAPGSLANVGIPRFFEAYGHHQDSINAWQRRNLKALE